MVGHLIPVVLAVGYLVGAVAGFTHNAPGVVGMTLLVAGVLMPVLAWHSFHRSRPAWAFLVAICGVFAVVELFGAPKVRGALDLSLWLTMILPGLNVVAVAALVSLRAERHHGAFRGIRPPTNHDARRRGDLKIRPAHDSRRGAQA